MEVIDRIAPLREILCKFKMEGRTISCVPTMGALHDGHKSCLEIAKREGDILVVSIYVNPKQFGPKEDFENYPRNLKKDLNWCEQFGCDVVFTPDDDVMYPVPQEAWVTVDRFTGVLCGRTRPGHFKGVVTVVAKLFNIIQPDVAVFGQKDAQQAFVIREMVRQLNFPVRIVLSPIVREPDGLAVSSRNAYLSPEARERATGLHKGLQAGRSLIEEGERDPGAIVEGVRKRLLELGIHDIEYVELLKADDFSPLERMEGKTILALATKLDMARLIDNIVLDIETNGTIRESLLF